MFKNYSLTVLASYLASAEAAQIEKNNVEVNIQINANFGDLETAPTTPTIPIIPSGTTICDPDDMACISGGGQSIADVLPNWMWVQPDTPMMTMTMTMV